VASPSMCLLALFVISHDCNRVSCNASAYIGAWLLCDGGYHMWRATIAGYKHSGSDEAIRWSER
jgi:hypothetical protein